MITFDIETKPHFDGEWVEGFKTPFNEEDVKVGNIKDATKIAEKIEKEREKHDSSFYENALLNPILSQVFSYQVMYPLADAEIAQDLPPDKSTEIEIDNKPFGIAIWINDEENDVREQAIVRQAFEIYKRVRHLYHDRGLTEYKMIGHNIFGFDNIYLARKAWQFDITIPYDYFHKGYFHPLFEDTANIWRMGIKDSSSKVGQRIKLDKLARYFKIGSKEDIGEFLYDIYLNDPDRALAYMANDLVLAYRCYRRMVGQ